jgi:anti-sigma regulatory factor (Ser/Thr protein kinase)
VGVADGSRHAATALPATPSSVGAARSFVRQTLHAWGLDELAETAMLLTSELTTNALLHAGTDLEVRLEMDAQCVRIAVLDRSPRPAVRRRHGPHAGTGRGLGLVEAMSTAWGSCGATDGWRKAIWFALPLEPSALPGSAEGALYGDDWLAMLEDL